jgi:membrane-bound lytic murein transglycosylase B
LPPRLRLTLRALALLLLATAPALHAAPAAAPPFPATAVRRFIDRMVRVHRFPRAEMVRLFQSVRPLARVLALIHAPAESLPWPVYRRLLVTPARVTDGQRWMRAHARALAQATAATGVPGPIVTAIIGVESDYGRNIGSFPVVDSLATLAFDDPGREAFFAHQLARYLVLCRRYGFDAKRLVGSYAGALGIPQFLPGDYLRYAVAARPGRAPDLFNSSNDAIASVSHYLAAHGWRRGEPVARRLPPGAASWPVSRLLALDPTPRGRRICLPSHGHHDCWLTYHNFRVLMTYNASWLYALAVDGLARRLGRGHGPAPTPGS